MTWRAHLRGFLVAFCGFAILVLGFPGLDGAPAAPRDPAARQQLLARPGGWLRLAAAEVNRRVRMPVNRVLTPIQRPLRLAQAWNLYTDGPGRPARLELLVDDQLVHRSNDPDHPWLAEVLAYRRIRPIGATICTGKAKVQEGMLQYLRARAQVDFPAARRLTVRCQTGRWADPEAYRDAIRFTLAAPDWRVAVERVAP